MLETAELHSFSTQTDCGPGLFSLTESFAWLSLATDAGTSTATVSLTPSLNSEAGVYDLTLVMTL